MPSRSRAVARATTFVLGASLGLLAAIALGCKVPDPAVDPADGDGADAGLASGPKVCKQPFECESRVCRAAGTCAEAAPTDGVRNADETDIDCGGNAASKCEVLKACKGGPDCSTGVCKDVGSGSQCQPPAVDDGVKNGDETDIDCGGLTAPKCADEKGCSARRDCVNDVCAAGTCQPAVCVDAAKNNSETDVDCGGSGCPRCDDRLRCKGADDCKSGVCKESDGVLLCAVARPDDGVKNGTETDVDCGGGAPLTPACAVDRACIKHEDCASDGCAYGGRCAPRRSCTGKYGGDTCGSGGEGGRGKAAWESCCASAPAGVDGVSMNKYQVTSGRMREFLTRVKGNVRKSVQDARTEERLHGAVMDPSWDLYLPTAMDGCEQNGSCAPNEIADHAWNDPTTYQGIYTSAYRHLGGTIFNGQSLGQQGCSVGSPGTHSYYMDAATQLKYFGDVPAEHSQSTYDTKPLNCVNYLMAQAFCIWDGGRLETQAEYKAAGAANPGIPWGTPTPKGQASQTYFAFRYPSADDALLRGLGLLT